MPIDPLDEISAQLAIESFGNAGIATMSRATRIEFLTSAFALACGLLRGAAGDSYVRGMLDSAIDDLSSSPDIVFREPN